MSTYDATIVGGGPAGLQVALLMARGRTRVAVYDSGAARHLAGAESHSFLGTDGMPPVELRRRGRKQLEPYDTVDFQDGLVEEIERLPNGRFRVSVRDQPSVTSRFVLLATGMCDIHLDLPGYAHFWGSSLLHCPYCHGWEFRDRRLGVLVTDEALIELAKKVIWWSNDVVLFVSPELELPSEQLRDFLERGVTLERRSVRCFLGDIEAGRLEAVELADGAAVARDAVYYREGCTKSAEPQPTVRTGLAVRREWPPWPTSTRSISWSHPLQVC